MPSLCGSEVAFSTTPKMAEEIDRMARAEGRTRSELLREAVRAYRSRDAGDEADVGDEGDVGVAVADDVPAAYGAPATHEAPATYASAAASAAMSGTAAPTKRPPSQPAGFEAIRVARPQIARVCRKAGVTRLWVFGSALREDFDLQRSDVDFLVEWSPDAPKGPWLSHLLDLERELASVLGRRVDVVELDTVGSASVRSEMERERALVYDAVSPT